MKAIIETERLKASATWHREHGKYKREYEKRISKDPTLKNCKHNYLEEGSGYKVCIFCGSDQNKNVFNTKFKVGDRIKLIKYGHKYWENKKERKRLFKVGYCNEKPDNIIYEDKNCYYIDSSPHLVGKEGIIAQVEITQRVAHYDIWFLYNRSSASWFFDNQLKKVNFFISVCRLLIPNQ